MRIEGKIYKVIYVLKGGRRITNPSLRYIAVPNVELKWEPLPDGKWKGELRNKAKPLVPREYGIHWFGILESAKEVFRIFPLTTDLSRISHLEIWEANLDDDTYIWFTLGEPMGCSYGIILDRLLFKGVILENRRVNWIEVQK
jgi:hypothetical protein